MTQTTVTIKGMSVEEWRSIISLAAFLSPILTAAALYWLSKIFLKKDDHFEHEKQQSKEWEDKLNGQSSRIDEIKDNCRGNLTSTENIRLLVADHTHEIAILNRDFGKLQNSVERLETTSDVNKHEIIDVFQRRAKELGDQLTALDKTVAILVDRQTREDKHE
jgi:septal ring factor EnvC (AmiA/AmiB activator)